jgi:hypothetical protein
MRQRCSDPNCKSYPRYGGRGITICKEWEYFLVFEEWSILNGFLVHLSIDRINNNLGYSPDNCRWATKSTQAHNRETLPNTQSGYTGVAKNGINWQAYLYINRKLVYIGTYTNKVDAAIARNNYIIGNSLPHKLNIITNEN